MPTRRIRPLPFSLVGRCQGECGACKTVPVSSLPDQSTWERILLAVIGGVIIYALALVVGGLAVGDTAFDVLGFGPDDGNIRSGDGRAYLRLVYGVLGSVIVGWMLTLATIVVGPLRRRERWAWTAVVAGVVVWFVLDTGLSLVLGFVGHALFNVTFAIALAVPLAAIRNHLPSA